MYILQGYPRINLCIEIVFKIAQHNNTFFFKKKICYNFVLNNYILLH